MAQERRYQRKERTAVLAFIREKGLQDETIAKIAARIRAEMGIVVSEPTVLTMRTEVQSVLKKIVLDKTAAVAAKAQEQALTALTEVDTGRFVKILNAQVDELYGRLYDPYYSGKLPKPENLSDRLRMDAQLSTAISNLLSIMGPPKMDEGTYGGLIPKRDVMALLAERQVLYKAEFLKMGQQYAQSVSEKSSSELQQLGDIHSQNE